MELEGQLGVSPKPAVTITVPLTVDGYIVGSATVKDDGQVSLKIDDPEYTQQLQELFMTGFADHVSLVPGNVPPARHRKD